MCGRYTVTTTGGQLAATFPELAELGDQGSPRFNVAPTQQVPAVVARGGKRSAELLRWGLIPHWAKDKRIGVKLINARAETVDTKPAYRTLFRSAEHRCLLVADGFYEWLASEDPRQPRVPVRFSLPDDQPFAFAGLWTTWRSSETGEAIASATIITTTANRLVAPVHSRMPVILDRPALWSAWLSERLTAVEASTLLEPLRCDLLVAKRADPRVNSAKNEGPELLQNGALQTTAA